MAAIHEFVRLIVRDYLTSNGLDDTLEMFLQDCERKKWKNPDPEHWYQLTEALDLPEMMQDYGNEGSIISVLVKYLVKNRQKKVIPIPLVKKMEAKKGTMRLSKSQPALDLPPRPQTAPESSILTKHGPVCKETRPQKSLKKQGQRGKSSSNKLKSRNRPQTGILRTRSPVRDLDRPDLSHIPQKQKDRMFNRELQNVRDTLIARENTSRRRQMLSTRLRVEAGLEEARNDSYQKKNVKCMLCTQSFRPHQLKGRASYKSIMDIRSIWKPTMPELNPVLAKPPRCYDKVKVCVFCAQFVGNVEAYRVRNSKCQVDATNPMYSRRLRKRNVKND